MAAIAAAMMMPWKTSAEASAWRSAPMARAIAAAIAPPMLELAICCISMMSGKTSDSPASACGPMRPTKCASTVAVTAMSTTLTTTFGAASRSSVATIGPSRRRRVRAAAGFAVTAAVTARALEALAFVMLAFVMLAFVMLAFVMALPPVHRVEQRLDDASLQKPGGCVGARRLVIYAQEGCAAKHH